MHVYIMKRSAHRQACLPWGNAFDPQRLNSHNAGPFVPPVGSYPAAGAQAHPDRFQIGVKMKAREN